MNETLSYIGHRFAKGLREATFEFVAPLILAACGAKTVIRFVSHHLDSAMAEARKNAERDTGNKRGTGNK